MNLYWEDLPQGVARLQFLVRSNKLIFHKINLDSDQGEIRNANIKIQLILFFLVVYAIFDGLCVYEGIFTL